MEQPLTLLHLFNLACCLSERMLRASSRAWRSSSNSAPWWRAVAAHQQGLISMHPSQSCHVPLHLQVGQFPSGSAALPFRPFGSQSDRATSYLGRSIPYIRIDSSGKLSHAQTTILNLVEESRLHVREALLLEQPSALIQPRLLPRRHCILLTLSTIKLLIFVDRVYVFSP